MVRQFIVSCAISFAFTESVGAGPWRGILTASVSPAAAQQQGQNDDEDPDGYRNLDDNPDGSGDVVDGDGSDDEPNMTEARQGDFQSIESENESVMSQVDHMDQDGQTVSVQTVNGPVEVPGEWDAETQTQVASSVRGTIVGARLRIEKLPLARLERYRVPAWLALLTYQDKSEARRRARSSCRSAYRNSRAAARGQGARGTRGPGGPSGSGIATNGQQAGGAHRRVVTGSARVVSRTIATSRACARACGARASRGRQVAALRGRSGGGGRRARAMAQQCQSRAARNGDRSSQGNQNQQTQSSAGAGSSSGGESAANPMSCVPMPQPVAQAPIPGQTPAPTPPPAQANNCSSALSQMMQGLSSLAQTMMMLNQVATQEQLPAMPATDCSNPEYAKNSVMCICQNDPKNRMCTEAEPFGSGIVTTNAPMGPASPTGPGLNDPIPGDGLSLGQINAGRPKTASGSSSIEGGASGGMGRGGGLQAINGSGDASGPVAQPPNVILGVSSSQGGGGGGGGGYSGGSGGTGFGGRGPTSDGSGFNIANALPRHPRRLVTGMTIPSRDGVTSPLGPTLFEKVSNQYQIQKRNLIQDR